MNAIAGVLVFLVALIHVGFAILEMFLWTGPIGMRIFGQTPEFMQTTAVLAANQGLYNLLLAGGLAWGALSGRRDLRVFFLVCVIAAGVFGGMTAKASIMLTQAAPAAVALFFVLLARSKPA
jgi:putative membrane protein